jgi:hypothetical protein
MRLERSNIKILKIGLEKMRINTYKLLSKNIYNYQ